MLARMKTHPTSLITRISSVLAAPVLLAVALLASSASVAAAQEPPIQCGTVVTSDVRLSADLLDCPGSGLVIGASGVTIDLAGHLIDGTGAGAGIDNGAGHDDVRITGGTVQGFLFGVHLFETAGSHVDRLVAQSNADGVIIGRSDRVELDRVTASDNLANGIEIGFSDRTVVRRSTAADNGLYGVFDVASTGSAYVRNLVTGNAAPGLALWFSGGSVVERNQATANDGDGIQLTGVEDAVVHGNQADANLEQGISVDQPGNTLARNLATGNGGLGIAAADGTIDGGRNRARDNLGGDCTGVVCR
jgi:hypothetical protein